MDTSPNGDLHELIACVYDAATDPLQWPPFLERFARMTGSSEALLLMHDQHRAEPTVSSSWGSDATSLKVYQDSYCARITWTDDASRGQAGYLVAAEEIRLLPKLIPAEFCNDTLPQMDFRHALFGLVADHPQMLVTMGFFRDSQAGEFLDDARHLLRRVMPHIHRAHEIHFELSRLKSQLCSVKSAVDMLAFGVVFVSATHEVLHMNARAQRHARAGKGFRVSSGKMVLSKSTEDDNFQSLITAASRASSRVKTHAGGSMRVTGPEGTRLCLTVAPLQAIDTLKQATAVIFMMDPHDRTELPADWLRRCHGLTRAECRLVALLIEGKSTKEAAESLCVSPNTAKAQLRSIFAKTGVRRQAELVKLLLVSGGSLLTCLDEVAASEV